MDQIRFAEDVLFDRFASALDTTDVPLVFILGSPRTGSTLVYQVLINYFDFFYFSNFIADHFSVYPAVGAVLDQALNPRDITAYESEFGKTKGMWEPSEASAIFKNWFGGEHPSQTKSSNVLSGQDVHIQKTMKSIFSLTGRPVLSKNAWNCFRIAAIMELFPRSSFVWVRRDIRESAISDLASRYKHGGATIWNSATPSNYLEIQKLPYWQQVVEQQYEYNKTIEADLRQFSRGQFIEVWYEEMCRDAEGQVARLRDYFYAQHLPLTMKQVSSAQPIHISQGAKVSVQQDYSKIAQYVDEQRKRLSKYLFENR